MTTRQLPNQPDETIVYTMDLPVGQDFVVFTDCNVVGLSSRLDDAGRERALTEAGAR